jgi:hypothetical protein
VRFGDNQSVGGERTKGPDLPAEMEAKPTEDVQCLPRRISPSELFGPDRMKGVERERQSATAQIKNTMKVWRKAHDATAQSPAEQSDEKEEVSEPGEPAEQEADAVADEVAGAMHGDEKEGEDKEAGEEKTPKIGAKLDGVGRKIFLAKDDGGRSKPVNLPAEKSITVDMAHIKSGHMAGGNRNLAGQKDLFPKYMDEKAVEAAIREAYRTCKKLETQGDRVKLVGTGGSLTIEMWLNIPAKMIETAYPKF